MLIIPLLSVVSCNDDDGISPEHTSNVYRGESLNLTLNGQKINGKTVKFYTHDFKNADITLINTIPGEDSVLIKNIVLEYDGNNIYGFSGNNTSTEREINFTGKINVKGHLDIDVTYKILSNIIGRWQPSGYDLMPPSPIELIIEAKNPKDSINMGGFWGYSDKVSYEEFGKFIGDITTFTFALAIDLKLEFQANGLLNMNWGLKPGAVFPITPGNTKPEMIKFNTNGGYLYPSVAIDSLISVAVDSLISNSLKPKRLTKSTIVPPTMEDTLALIPLVQAIYKGMPLKYTLNNDNDNVDLWADHEMMKPYFESIIKVFSSAIRNEDLGKDYADMGVTGPILADLAYELLYAFNNSSKFEVHFRLSRIKEGENLYNNQTLPNKKEIIERFKSIHKTNNRK